jgi:hypothetical protein
MGSVWRFGWGITRRSTEACRQLGLSTKHMNTMLTGHGATLTLDWAERILGLCGKRVVITIKRRPRRQA